jgi:hypothetical protein
MLAARLMAGLKEPRPYVGCQPSGLAPGPANFYRPALNNAWA